ncbi:tRNA pseudouridine(55) synthase TruB [Arcanobacterium hippocoleae]
MSSSQGRKELSEHRPRREMPWGDLPRASAAADSGLLLVDKDQGVTSHDVVGAIRRLAGTRKVGHGGTLDPMATGLLTIGIGRATKLLTYLSGCEKAYRATICLGAGTNTEDADGEIIIPSAAESARTLALTAADIDRGISALTGEIMQVPSRFSALKVAGKRAHELARAGEDVQLAARPVRITRFVRLSEPVFNRELFDFPVITFDVEVGCSAGTYIRALGRDLGAVFGIGAHLRMLRRIGVRTWNAEDARSVAFYRDIAAAGKQLPVIPISVICRSLFPAVEITADEVRLLQNGQFIKYRKPMFVCDFFGSDSDLPEFQECGTAAAFDPAGKAVALLTKRGRFYKPDLQLTEI